MQTVPMLSAETQVRVNEFIRSVYNWMAIGLGLTGLVAFYVSNSQYLTQLIFGNQLLFFALIIGELVLVFSIAARVHKMQASTATGLFVLYAALTVRRFLSFFLFTRKHPLPQYFSSAPRLL